MTARTPTEEIAVAALERIKQLGPAPVRSLPYRIATAAIAEITKARAYLRTREP